MMPSIRTVTPTLAIAVGVAAFALPSAANAAVTSTFANGTLTVTSNDDADAITVGVSADGTKITATGAPADVPNDGTVNLVVNAGGGNDNINISAPKFAGSPVVNGGDGDDTILGSPRTDTIDGGNGNDRITGAKNTAAGEIETIHGGAGNDVIIWNNGDGDDLNEGDAGVDETLIVEGTADDGNTITQEGAVTRFERTSGAGGFKVFSNAMEKLSLQSFSGNDTVATGPGVPIPMSIDAGPGNDTITTGDGPDRIVADRGNDTINAGNGEDVMVWTNGDGNDVMNGDGGTDIVENDLGNGDDISTLKMENGRVRYDRVNAPFNLSIGSSEVMLLNTFGGNDTLTTAPDVGLWLDVNAGGGNDIIQGGAGSDRIDGGDGNDAVNVRDAVADLVTGGPGTDSATVDAGDAVGADVESVDRAAGTPVPAPAPAGQAKLAKTAKVSKNVAKIKVSCPAGTTGCKGSVALFSAKTIKVGRLKAKRELGRKSFNVAAGQSKTVNVKLARGTAKLAKKKKLAVTARAGDKISKLTLRF
jgi:Ca2+-binding RTX toxin-like protein